MIKILIKDYRAYFSMNLFYYLSHNMLTNNTSRLNFFCDIPFLICLLILLYQLLREKTHISVKPYFNNSSISLSSLIFPLASSIRMSFASCKNSLAKIKLLRRSFLLKIISLLLPLHSFCP
jgi:hypothetical protein